MASAPSAAAAAAEPPGSGTWSAFRLFQGLAMNSSWFWYTSTWCSWM